MSVLKNRAKYTRTSELSSVRPRSCRPPHSDEDDSVILGSSGIGNSDEDDEANEEAIMQAFEEGGHGGNGEATLSEQIAITMASSSVSRFILDTSTSSASYRNASINVAASQALDLQLDERDASPTKHMGDGTNVSDLNL